MEAKTKAEVLRRLRSVAGHVEGIARMVEEDAYCIDIIRQIQAVQRALAKVNDLVLAQHLRTCVTTAIRGEDPEERERVLEEIVEVFEAAQKI
ncbi:MAG: metal-sensitive transcriptional regulator [Thermoflexus sp.]|jgi:DNA-binding FrmR family transcriptional regulator|uniref:metal-sensitive transcriptional regulator n=1 Tax=Thermoflexus TaxID=1495649 RepID=UPI001C778DBE|nr:MULTISPECIES: metal-sensitive transcriptional regulator [Thermoflexus]MDT7884466.1 metal-sensitive transcriptional regulator [Thermoflexus sp.]MDT7948196.1 metal-sensitive transcriptional regulator [Thermoflexus sp.]QWK10007.1 MAG: metal-sensitive transcriptional regulator [Thermoflexus hugenholtzii]